MSDLEFHDAPLHTRPLNDGTRLELWRYLFNWRVQKVNEHNIILRHY